MLLHDLCYNPHENEPTKLHNAIWPNIYYMSTLQKTLKGVQS